jgi:hypothetical protein
VRFAGEAARSGSRLSDIVEGCKYRRPFVSRISFQGASLGNSKNLAAAGSIGRAVQISGADAFAAALLPIVQTLQSAGTGTLEAITRGLNKRGVCTARGAGWHVSSVANLLSGTKTLAEAR